MTPGFDDSMSLQEMSDGLREVQSECSMCTDRATITWRKWRYCQACFNDQSDHGRDTPHDWNESYKEDEGKERG